MKRERTSYAFLLEMIWVCAFFLICASIFVMAFAKAEQVSRQADVLNQAVQASSNVMEEALAVFETSDPEAWEADASPRFPEEHARLGEIPGKYFTDDFTIELYYFIENGLVTVTVRAITPVEQSVIYTLTGAKALPEGGAS